MEDFKSVVQYEIREYGHVTVKLAELLKKRGITRNHLRTLTGVKYDVIDRYYKAETVQMVDLDFISKVCFALDCSIDDLLEYHPPK